MASLNNLTSDLEKMDIFQPSQALPTIALTLGDAAGIGSELIAKLIAEPATQSMANIVIVGDRWQWEAGQITAGKKTATQLLTDFSQVRARPQPHIPALIETSTIALSDVVEKQSSAPCGRAVLQVLDLCLNAAVAKQIDAICFAPLNKQAMKLGGMQHDDELHYFANHLKVDSYFCEFNTLDRLWTSRISSHVPLSEVPQYVTKERIHAATKLIYTSLEANGVENPRVAVVGFNPHNGEGGTCGREEIDIIIPAVAELNEQGYKVDGPFSPDTIFLRARDGDFDAVVTMYHDQGQIALKLLGFSRGVTVQGGLPIPITTPAHGTAYDIAGKGIANVDAMRNAFKIACTMATRLKSKTST